MMRRRGFTLVELLVYMGLVATALMIFGGIELAAQRQISLQGRLIDIERQATASLGALRRDVEASVRLEERAEGAELVVHRMDKATVIYRRHERIVLDASGKRNRETFQLLTSFKATIAKGTVRAEAVFRSGDVERSYRRAASARREVSGD